MTTFIYKMDDLCNTIQHTYTSTLILGRKLHVYGSVALCLYIQNVIDPVQITTYCKEAVKTWFKCRIINIDHGMVHLFTYHELTHCNY